MLLAALFSLALARPLTLEEAQSMAQAANPTLALAGTSEARAEAALLSARGVFDPRATASTQYNASSREGFFQGFPYQMDANTWQLRGGVSGATATGTGYAISGDLAHDRATYRTSFGEGMASESLQEAYTANFSASLTQELLKGHRLAYNAQHVRQARAALTQSALQRRAARVSTAVEVERAYWGLHQAERLAHISREALAVAEESARVGRLQREAGELAPLELTRLEAALVSAEVSLLDAESALAKARDALSLAMGAPTGSDWSAASPLRLPPLPPLDAEAVVAVALAQNPTLLIAREKVEATQDALVSARHATLPAFTAELGMGRGAQDLESAGGALADWFSEDGFPTWSAGATLSAPLGNRAARGSAAEAAAAHRAAQFDLAAQEASLRAQVEQQLRLAAGSAARVRLAEAQARLAEETLRAEEALAQAGRRLLKDTLEARAAFTRAQSEAVTAQVNARLAWVELLQLQGERAEDIAVLRPLSE